MITPANLLLMACAEQKRPDRMWVTRIINAEQFDNIAAVKPYAPSGFTLRGILHYSNQTDDGMPTARMTPGGKVSLRSIMHTSTQVDDGVPTARMTLGGKLSLRSIMHTSTQTDDGIPTVQMAIRTPILLRSLSRQAWGFPDVPRDNPTVAFAVDAFKLTKVL
jgi:hypothetical protein|nr:MAG TPA: hypothetical protein [Caudoviricetes sp.]